MDGGNLQPFHCGYEYEHCRASGEARRRQVIWRQAKDDDATARQPGRLVEMAKKAVLDLLMNNHGRAEVQDAPLQELEALVAAQASPIPALLSPHLFVLFYRAAASRHANALTHTILHACMQASFLACHAGRSALCAACTVSFVKPLSGAQAPADD